MNWLFWVLIGFFVFGGLSSVASVGKRREPLTPGTAVVIVALDAALILAVILGWPT